MLGRRFLLGLAVVAVLVTSQLSSAQESSGNSSWTSSSQQQDPNGALNPVRTREVHSETGGRTVDRQSLEIVGPDGQYVPYRDTETESVRVDPTTVRTIQRTYGRGPDGQRTLVQVQQEDARTLPGGDQHIVRTLSSPDANGNLQVARRELEDSKDVSAGVRDTKTTVLTPDVNGGFTPAIRTEERQTKAGDGTIQFKKSTSLSDGNGSWQLTEVREGTRKLENGKEQSKDERILRPDANGDLAVVERTVSRKTEGASGEKRETVDKYSQSVPGASGDGSLQLVQRETTVHRDASSGAQTTTHQVEQVNPASPGEGVRFTGQTVDIVRPDSSGNVQQQRTVISLDSDGRQSTVWVDVGKTDNPAVVKVDTRTPDTPPPPKPH
jgi:hypothetical protein